MSRIFTRIWVFCTWVSLTLFSFFETNAQTYCIPSATNSISYINDFYTTDGMTNVSNMGSGYSTGGYGDFTFLTPIVSQTNIGTVTINANYIGGSVGAKVWVDWNQNGSFEDPGELVSGPTGTSAFTLASFTVPPNALPGNTRMRIGMSRYNPFGPANSCEQVLNGEYEDYNFYVIPKISNDAGISSLSAPLDYCAGPTPQPIKVNVSNFGDNTIDSVKIQWELDGVLQPDYNLTTPLVTNTGLVINELTVTLGSYVFLQNPVVLKVWTTMPNGVPDSANLNDTLTHTFYSALSGSYTINSSTATGGMNFQSFADFTTAINTYGICGPVVANVSGGPFVEKVVFGPIIGANSINTIRVNGNGAMVQFANNGYERQLLTLDGTHYLTIDNLTFKSLDYGYGWAALITNSAAYDSIINCFFDLTSVNYTSAANTNGIVFSASSTSATAGGTSGRKCYIGNNYLKWSDSVGGGYYGLTLTGSSDSNIIANNIFENVYAIGTYIDGAKGSKILNNTYHKENKTHSLTAFTGIFTKGITPGTEIRGNKIHDPGGLNGNTIAAFHGIYLTGDGTPAQPNIVANNLIYNVNLDGALYGLYLDDAPYTSLYHNTVVFDNAYYNSAETVGIYAKGSNTNTKIKNNNIVITTETIGPKYGFYYFTPLSINDVQKNNFYLNSTQTSSQYYGYLGSAFPNKAAFQTANPLFELGSPSTDPLFVNPSLANFFVQSPLLIGHGENLLTIVPIDIDSNPRATLPVIGAYEKAPIGYNNAGMLNFASPIGNYCAGQQSVSATINNGGLNDITSVQIHWTVNGIPQPMVNYTGTLNPPSLTGNYTATVVLGNVNISTGTPTLIKAWTSMPNGVPDVNNNNDTIDFSFQTSHFYVASVADSVCFGGNTILSLNPSTGYNVGDLQWQSSINGNTWSDIPNTDDVAYFETFLLANKYFRVKVWVDSNYCYSDSLQVKVVTVNTPTAVSAERCGPGSVNLSVTGATGNTLKWYDVMTGGTPIATTPIFTTPILNATTNYFVEAALLNSVGEIGRIDYNGISQWMPTGTGQGILFDVLSDINLDSVSVFVVADAGTIVLQLQDSSNNVLANRTFTFSGSGATSTSKVKIYLPVNLSIPIGNSYKILAVQGTTATLSREMSGYPPFNTYKINNVISLVSNWNNGFINISQYNYFYDFAVSVGCTSPRQMVTATIKPLPVVNLGNDTSICPNAIITLDANNLGNAVLWYNNSTAQTLNVTTPGIYSVTVTGNNNCSKSDTITIAAGIVPVNNLPAISDLCENTTLTLDAGNTGSTYLWSNAATTQTTNISSVGNYNVVITSVDGCDLTSNTAVTSRPLPIVDLGNDTAICAQGQFILNAGNLGMSYLWNTGESTQTIGVNTANTYSVTVTSPYNCKGSDTIAIAILPLPIVDAFNSIDLGNEQAGKVQFNPINPQNVTSYDWNFGDGSSHSSDVSPIHIYTSDGVFTVTLKVKNACGESQVNYTVMIEGVGITQLDGRDVNFTLYPNPSSAEIIITNESIDIKMLHISIVNVLGVIVYDKTIKHSQVQKVDVSLLASGLYTARILTDKGLVVMKFEVIK